MIKTHGAYDTATGRITRTWLSTEDGFLAHQAIASGEATFSGAHTQEGHFIDTNNGDVITARTALGASWDVTSINANGVDIATLSGLPQPCDVEIDGVRYTITDGSLQFTAVDAGQYHFVVDHPHHIAEEWTVDAN